MKIFTSIAIVLVFCVSTDACDWMHWRGPHGNSVAPDAHPPVAWSASTNVKWKVAIAGNSSGSPVVWQDRVVVVSGVPTGKRLGRLPELAFVTFCFDRDSGDLIWQQTATVATPHQATHETNGFASASPCTDGNMIYSYFGSRGLYAYTMDGQLVWKRDDFGKMITRNDFGEGSSPVIAGDKIIVPWDHEGPSFLYAIDKTTGATIWKTPRDEPTCWATPLVIPDSGASDSGGAQVVMNGQTKARAYDLETGKELWSCGGQTQRPVATPVYRDGIVYVGSGFRGSFLAALKTDGRGNVEGTDAVVWSVDRDTPDIASLLLSENRLYFFKAKTGLLSCLNAIDGRAYYKTVRLPNISTTYASPVAAGGHVYLTGRSGTTVVIDDAETFNVVSINSVGEGVDATPAVVDNEIFIRGAKHLFCIAQQ